MLIIRTRYLSSSINGIRTVLLSNISIVHLNHVAHECANLFRLFEATYFSCETGLRKPSAEAFLAVCTVQNARPEHVLLIDDSVANCAQARALGMKVFRVERRN